MMDSQAAAESSMLLILFVLVVAWATGVDFADVGLAKGAFMLVKIPVQIGGVMNSLVPGGYGAIGAFLFLAAGVFPFLKGALGEGLWGFMVVATIAAIISGAFY